MRIAHVAIHSELTETYPSVMAEAFKPLNRGILLRINRTR